MNNSNIIFRKSKLSLKEREARQVNVLKNKSRLQDKLLNQLNYSIVEFDFIESIINQDTCGNGLQWLEPYSDGNIYSSKKHIRENKE